METKSNHFVPKAVFIDTEPSSTSSIQKSYPDLYFPEQFISSNEDSSNIYIQGYIKGISLQSIFQDRIRKLTEACDKLKGFMIFHSLNGGTGSGLGGLLLESLSTDYSKSFIFTNTIFPSPKISSNNIEAYNAVFGIHELIEYSSVSLIYDNEALYNICSEKLYIEMPEYMNINRLIAQNISSLTGPIRFNSEYSMDFIYAQNHLMPYPRLHFHVSAYAPFVQSEKSYQNEFSVADITNCACESSSLLACCDLQQGKYFFLFAMYRGDLVFDDIKIAASIIRDKPTIQFYDWCQNGLKFNINHEPLFVVPGGDLAKISRSICMVNNSSAIREVFYRVRQKCRLMYSKKAFVHWFYSEGLNDDSFNEVFEDIDALQMDYLEV
ncbi:hypothetical protein SteCoe_21129 [Stentor coeruleus]|uniref:Tubulin alpha chain n=1 Tax=Stentor coeruleus TaxID=5963 RepID=A0A1R2BQF0_9CILI|nr:hypothetical protein SteCoe_21129 [Stentor coeruleus]